MKKIKSLIISIGFIFVLVFSCFGGNSVKAHASNFQLSYDEYSAKITKILSEFCEFKTRIAGSENEKASSEYIKEYLIDNATKTKSVNNSSTQDGVQTFKYLSDYTGVYQTSQNVIFEYKSTEKTDKKVILACNYDAPVRFDDELFEYVSFNNDALNASAAGVATLLMLAETLPNYNINFNLEFVFFGAGEDSCAGSEFYLHGLSEEEEKNILCVINIDKIALGEKMYFYIDEVKTDFSKYVSRVCSAFSKEVDILHLNKLAIEDKLGLGYTHIGLESDNTNFMSRGIATINMFAGDYETGIIMGRNEYNGKEIITYSSNDTIEYAKQMYGQTEIIDNLYAVNSSIETLLIDGDFIEIASKTNNQTLWFYSIFANKNLVVLITLIAFVIILIISMYIYLKLNIKSYYANIEVEFLSSVVKISENIGQEGQEKDVAKLVGQVLANDIKKNKTLKREKRKNKK